MMMTSRPWLARLLRLAGPQGPTRQPPSSPRRPSLTCQLPLQLPAGLIRPSDSPDQKGRVSSNMMHALCHNCCSGPFLAAHCLLWCVWSASSSSIILLLSLAVLEPSLQQWYGSCKADSQCTEVFGLPDMYNGVQSVCTVQKHCMHNVLHRWRWDKRMAIRCSSCPAHCGCGGEEQL